MPWSNSHSLGTMVKLLTRGVKVSDYRPDDTDEELGVSAICKI